MGAALRTKEPKRCGCTEPLVPTCAVRSGPRSIPSHCTGRRIIADLPSAASKLRCHGAVPVRVGRPGAAAPGPRAPIGGSPIEVSERRVDSDRRKRAGDTSQELGLHGAGRADLRRTLRATLDSLALNRATTKHGCPPSTLNDCSDSGGRSLPTRPPALRPDARSDRATPLASRPRATRAAAALKPPATAATARRVQARRRSHRWCIGAPRVPS